MKLHDIYILLHELRELALALHQRIDGTSPQASASASGAFTSASGGSASGPASNKPKAPTLTR